MIIKTIAKLTDTRSKSYNIIFNSPIACIFDLIHKLVVLIELLVISIIYKGRPKYISENEISIIIKTFERPKQLKRLVKSIKKLYPNLKIIVADDGRISSSLADVTYIKLPFNSGVSYGRNVALSMVNTPYVLSLDDDFIFYADTKIEDSLEVIKNNPAIDLIGGKVINLPFFRVSAEGGFLYTENDHVMEEDLSHIASLKVCRKVPQFFIARTEKIRAIGWDEEIKKLDHAVFFSRISGILTTVYNPNFSILHARTPFNKDYLHFRLDLKEDLEVIIKKYYRAQAV